MNTIDTSPKVTRRLILECNHIQTTMGKYQVSEAQEFIGKSVYCIDCKYTKQIVDIN